MTNHGGIQLRFGLGAATLLSLLFIIEAAAMAGIVAGGAVLIQIPAIDPQVAALLIVGTGPILGFGFIYKSYS